ncbi:MAG: 1-deoxy-D-xylulose-5-phosphate reductoisomerase [Clostridiales bacterium]|jgi:1-deoxy-D-xylulose-5-phosphate reductoisomerase|nr:1-deoxy-D-xylulose-5-phosphate reductoisomerase [Clostridiales bacterium]
MVKSISVVGSTGSIGRQTLEVAAFLGIRVRGLAANGNIGLLREQALAFRPDIASVGTRQAAEALAGELGGRLAGGAAGASGAGGSGGRSRAGGAGRGEGESGGSGRSRAGGAGRNNGGGGSSGGPELCFGEEGLRRVAAESGADMTVVAVSGAAGLAPVISAIKAKKSVALANKEAMVMAGRLIMALAAENSAAIIPVDSEHSAIFQCLAAGRGDARRLVLTASGGPFRAYGRKRLDGITPQQAAAHPVWSMGRKISIDSATMANKGLEVIEAARLFGFPRDRISVLLHPESIVHSMVEFADGSVMAQMGAPDMRTPIQYALTYPDRRAGLAPALDLAAAGRLRFSRPDMKKFRCLELAYGALEAGGDMPAVYNAANEEAVGYFVGGRLSFTQIPALIEKVMDGHAASGGGNGDGELSAILEADAEARRSAARVLGAWEGDERR